VQPGSGAAKVPAIAMRVLRRAKLLSIRFLFYSTRGLRHVDQIDSGKDKKPSASGRWKSVHFAAAHPPRDLKSCLGWSSEKAPRGCTGKQHYSGRHVGSVAVCDGALKGHS